MKLKPALASICAFLFFAAACNPSRESLIIGLWQEVGLLNPQIEEAIEQQRQFLDTVGLHTDSLANITRYGTSNIDTFKKSIRTNLDSFKKAQRKAVSETWFDFHKDGTVYLHSIDGLDSAKWYFEDDGALMLDEEKMKGGGAKIRMEMEELSDTALRLRFSEKYLNSTASFKRVKR